MTIEVKNVKYQTCIIPSAKSAQILLVMSGRTDKFHELYAVVLGQGLYMKETLKTKLSDMIFVKSQIMKLLLIGIHCTILMNLCFACWLSIG